LLKTSAINWTQNKCSDNYIFHLSSLSNAHTWYRATSALSPKTDARAAGAVCMHKMEHGTQRGTPEKRKRFYAAKYARVKRNYRHLNIHICDERGYIQKILF
jgi:hypothetical protein